MMPYDDYISTRLRLDEQRRQAALEREVRRHRTQAHAPRRPARSPWSRLRASTRALRRRLRTRPGSEAGVPAPAAPEQ